MGGVPDAGSDGGTGVPDASSEGGIDAGAEARPERVQLHPAVEHVSDDRGHLLGRLGAHGVQTASTADYRLRGGFRPLTR